MFSEEQIRKLEVRYAGILIQLLATEDFRHPGVNHYTQLQEIVTTHFHAKNIEIEDMSVFLAIEKAVTEIASSLLKNGDCFDRLHSGDIFDRVKPILIRNLEKSQ